ncbi:proteasomal ubiquitin receptor ADRM1 isoform X1 [Ceratina calcarata]|uniref:Proteasomal ubiquitin receptor ADRM1 homolog n=1 Tax=Ceratina calcarata TaxID=156304 RepID=A0AAJ7N9I5_9HYME|nr:proteasomal ubiquitin receptor ADRM1 isoform X1 [Ceratina calcarata]
MSGGSLFGSNASRGTPKNLVEFKAGKMTMKGKMIYPDIRKGQLYVYQSDDSLMHFCWKDRVSGYVEDDLIIFPDDCEFKHVPQCKTGRVYLLRFKSSNKKFFVWLQDLKTDKDEEYCRKINEVLNNPPTPGSQRSGCTNPEEDLHNLLSNMSQQQFMQLFSGADQVGLGNLLGTVNRLQGVQSTRASTMTASTRVTTNASRPSTQVASTPASTNDSTKSTNGDSKSSSTTSTTATRTPGTSTPSGNTTAGTNNKIQLSALHNFLSRIRTPGSEYPVYQWDVVTELTHSIPSAISVTESLERAMSPHLPPGDRLCTTLVSPQFSRALSMFWSALQSGQAGPVISQFGLGPEAVNAAASGNIEEFVNALESEAKSSTGQQQPEQQTQQQQQQQPQQQQQQQQQQGQQEEKNAKEQQAPPPASSSPDKKDDDDEFMALD